MKCSRNRLHSELKLLEYCEGAFLSRPINNEDWSENPEAALLEEYGELHEVSTVFAGIYN